MPKKDSIHLANGGKRPTREIMETVETVEEKPSSKSASKSKFYKKSGLLWDGIGEEDYYNEDNVEEKDMGSFNLEKMTIYALNATCARHIIDSIDSLKPVERRILYTMYQMKAFIKGNTGSKKKCQSIVGETNKYHPHGGGTIYDTLVGMSQYWKKAIPLIKIHGSKGDPTIEKYAAERYTEATISPYAYECFFETYDASCVEMTTVNQMETIPVSLPSKFPNILLNGGIGIAYGYSFTIPSYNPADVIMATKRLLKDPNDNDFYIYPDLPTGCDIIEDGGELRTICETGIGKLHMRARIDILEERNKWILRITSIPWLSSAIDIKSAIAELQKRGGVTIDDVQDKSEQTRFADGTIITNIKIDVVLNKALDPYATREILYKNTTLDRTVSIQFRMVDEGTKIVQEDLYSALSNWIDTRREYLRRIYRKKLDYTDARIHVLQVFIQMKDPKRIKQVMDTILKNSSDEAEKYLVENFSINSYQAKILADTKLNVFAKDKMMRYEEELPVRIEELSTYKKILSSEKEIDKIILQDLEDLKKYSYPRRSRIISAEDGPQIADTEHILVFTKKGNVKKLPAVAVGRARGYGQFASGDYPIQRIQISNLDSVIIFDSLGRFSVVPVHTIPNSLQSDTGESVYNIAKLEGEIVSVYPFFSPKTQRDLKKINKNGAYVFTLTKRGQMKKTPISEYTSIRSVKNVRTIKGKPGDQLAMAEVLLNTGNIMVYSKEGMCSILSVDDIPEMGKDSVGNQVLNISESDECRGFCMVNDTIKNILVVTEKGGMKRVDCSEGVFNSAIPMKRKNTVYLATLTNDDTIFVCKPLTTKEKGIVVWNRKDIQEYPLDQISVRSRKASCPKEIPVPNGDNIISVIVVPK